MKLQLTNNFRPYFDQLARLLLYIRKTGNNTNIPRSQISEALGLSDRQVKHLSNEAIEFGLIHPKTFLLTDFGEIIVDRDGFFEKIETLWVIHYNISSNPEWVVWNRMVNVVIPSNDTITISDVVFSYFGDLKSEFSEKTIADKLPKEIGVVLWTYAHSNLAKLKILEQIDSRKFQRLNPVDVSPLAFMVCLLIFRDKTTHGATAMTIAEISRGENSPGMVLNLPESIIRSLLNQLHDTGLVRLEQFGDLDQVRFQENLTKEKVLQRIYEV
jgi:hypothetical protein